MGAQKIKKARTIMVQGTGSGVGKSVIACALCRIFLQDGYSVAPFKSQNMALNSFVTEGGGEIGRAQAVQAMACKIKPTVDMNPVLIKPSSDRTAQIIVHGKPVRNMSVYGYKRYKMTVYGKMEGSFRKLAKEHDIVVIEGAGSPAEVNLKSHDLVNMKIAELANAPVILVGDIDKGGVFAWLIGTLELLTPAERKLIKGFVINKFRGDKRLLMSGLRFLEKRTGIKVLGVIPYYRGIRIPEEDSLPDDIRNYDAGTRKKIRVSVIVLPHMSNFDDFDSLGKEPDVRLNYVKNSEDLAGADVVILPGTKNTIEDLSYLKKSGIAGKIIAAFRANPEIVLVGICGGYQMLGNRVRDSKSIESRTRVADGLGILPIETDLGREKVLSQLRATDLRSGLPVVGYEIHHGRTTIMGPAEPVLKIGVQANKKGKRIDGAMIEGGRCWGTYVHGIFDNNEFRRHFLNTIRETKGWGVIRQGADHDPDREIDKLSDHVRKHINIDLLYDMIHDKACLKA